MTQLLWGFSQLELKAQVTIRSCEIVSYCRSNYIAGFSYRWFSRLELKARVTVRSCEIVWIIINILSYCRSNYIAGFSYRRFSRLELRARVTGSNILQKLFEQLSIYCYSANGLVTTSSSGTTSVHLIILAAS